MKGLVISGLAGAALVYASYKFADVLTKPGSDGKPPLGEFAAKNAGLLIGAAGGMLLHKFLPSAV